MLKQELLETALGFARSMYRALAEFSDLTVELKDAIQQQDTVTVRMFLKLRQEPLSRAVEHRRMLWQLCRSLPNAEAEHLIDILMGNQTNVAPEEMPLYQQIQRNRALLDRVVEADRSISLQIGRERSFYRKNQSRM